MEWLSVVKKCWSLDHVGHREQTLTEQSYNYVENHVTKHAGDYNASPMLNAARDATLPKHYQRI
jgi:hypothetical protein